MKRFFTFWAVLSACSLTVVARAETPRLPAPPIPRAPVDTAAYNMPNIGASKVSYFDEETTDVEQHDAEDQNHATADSCGCQTNGCCEPACGCQNGCADGCCNGCGGCDSGWGSCLGNCCLGDAWTLQSCLHPCCNSPKYGGWVSMGYYNHNERLSFDPGDELSFNDFPHHLNLDQAWFYIERVAEASACSADWGYRFDIMYGAQAHTTQAYGNPRALDGPNLGAWDASFDHGVYGWALPQLYGEVAFGDWSWKIGHWFTPVGYEVVPATGNFFYSHALTHYNSEPFTHTGVLGTYKGYDDVTFVGGWALGWDTGFEQFDGGNIFIGGLTYDLSDDVALTYMVTAGNLGWKSNGEGGFSGHFVGAFTLSKSLQYVLQHDYLTTDEAFQDPQLQIDDKGITNYLFYTLNDCWKVGTRVEWWKSNFTGDSHSYYEVTTGLNYRPHANLVFRPEIRYDWTPAEDTVSTQLGENRYNQWWFGIDAVLTY
jgi:hypothetical protein